MSALDDALARVEEEQLRGSRREKLAREMTHETPTSYDRPYLNSAQVLGMLGLPGVSDVAGLIGDAQMYRDRPEERTWGNYAMTGLGALPFVPSVAGITRLGKHATDWRNARAISEQGFNVPAFFAVGKDADQVSALYGDTVLNASLDVRHPLLISQRKHPGAAGRDINDLIDAFNARDPSADFGLLDPSPTVKLAHIKPGEPLTGLVDADTGQYVSGLQPHHLLYNQTVLNNLKRKGFDSAYQNTWDEESFAIFDPSRIKLRK